MNEYEKLLTHDTLKNETVNLTGGSYEAANIPFRVEVAARLLKSYQEANKVSNNSTALQGLWKTIEQHYFLDLQEILNQNDAEKLATFLYNFGNSYCWVGGITTSIDSYVPMNNQEYVIKVYWDQLVSLAEYLSILRLEHPENGPWGENIKTNIDELITLIENKILISIEAPMGIIKTDGLLIKDRSILHYRHISALYAALRLKEIDSNNNSICEIGGGLGLVALYAKRLGITDYTLLDLPITCLLAGHYLIHALGNNNVCLYGEELTDNSVKIFPFWESSNFKNKQFNITLNQDSLIEIDEDSVNIYLKEIQRFTKNYFVSINNEGDCPKTVHEFFKDDLNYKKIYRFKSWVRKGYVEEVYKIVN